MESQKVVNKSWAGLANILSVRNVIDVLKNQTQQSSNDELTHIYEKGRYISNLFGATIWIEVFQAVEQAVKDRNSESDLWKIFYDDIATSTVRFS